MITVFNGETIYEGTDVTEYNRICDILLIIRFGIKHIQQARMRAQEYDVSMDME